MDEDRAKPSVLLRLVLWCQLAVISTGCSLQQAHTCCPVYPPSRYRMTMEAVRVPPCGPDGLYHGYKKTVWKTWPDGWDEFAPTLCPEETPIEVIETPEAATADTPPADTSSPDQPRELPPLEPTQNGAEGVDGLLAPEPLDTLDLPTTDGAMRRNAGTSRVVTTAWEEVAHAPALVPATGEHPIRRLPPVFESISED